MAERKCDHCGEMQEVPEVWTSTFVACEICGRRIWRTPELAEQGRQSYDIYTLLTVGAWINVVAAGILALVSLIMIFKVGPSLSVFLPTLGCLIAAAALIALRDAARNTRDIKKRLDQLEEARTP